MADPIIEEKIEQVRPKTYKEIIEEGRELEKPKEEVKETPEEKVETKVDDKEEKRKEQEDLARKTAEEVVSKQKEEEKQRLEEAQRVEKAEKRKETLKPKWQTDPNAPKDKDGKPIPQSYDEIVEESRRIAREEILAEIEERDRKRAEEYSKSLKEQEDKKTEQKRLEEAQNVQLDKDLTDELNDLYASDKLPKIVDENNPNDAGVLAKQALFKQGIEINQKRAEQGLSPIRSIKIIYYEHYKPTQAAGANAPVQGATAIGDASGHEDEFVYARDGGNRKTLATIIAEEKARLLKRARQ